MALPLSKRYQTTETDYSNSVRRLPDRPHQNLFPTAKLARRRVIYLCAEDLVYKLDDLASEGNTNWDRLV